MDLNALSKAFHIDPQAIENLSQSADGQALMAKLQQDGGNTLNSAMQAGQNGSYAEMTALIKNVMGTAEGRALLQRLANQLQKP